MRYENGGDAERGGELRELVPHFLAQQGVQRGERLVKENASRLHGDGAGKGNALLLSAGKLMGVAPFKILEMHGAQRIAHAALQILCIFSGPQPKGDIFKHRHVRPEREILKHKAEIPLLRRKIDFAFLGKDAGIVQPDLALVRRFQPGDHPQKRCFAAAGWAEQRGKAPVLDLQRCGLNDLLFIKALRDLLQSNFHGDPLFCVRH